MLAPVNQILEILLLVIGTGAAIALGIFLAVLRERKFRSRLKRFEHHRRCLAVINDRLTKIIDDQSTDSMCGFKIGDDVILKNVIYRVVAVKGDVIRLWGLDPWWLASQFKLWKKNK